MFLASAASNFKPLRAEIVRHILTKSLETTVLYVIEVGVFVLWPLAKNLVLRLKFYPIFTSKIMCSVISWYTTKSEGSPSYYSTAFSVFGIYLHIESRQRLLLFYLSKYKASLTDLGTMIPNLCMHYQYFDLTFCIIELRLFSVYGTRQVNAG